MERNTETTSINYEIIGLHSNKNNDNNNNEDCHCSIFNVLELNHPESEEKNQQLFIPFQINE